MGIFNSENYDMEFRRKLVLWLISFLIVGTILVALVRVPVVLVLMGGFLGLVFALVKNALEKNKK